MTLGTGERFLTYDSWITFLLLHVITFSQAVKDAKVVGGFSTKIEVECRSLDEAREAATAGSDVIMLDNFSPEVPSSHSVLSDDFLFCNVT